MASHAGRWHLLTLLALVLAVTGMWATFGGPFARGWLGHNGARYAQIARNYERNGLAHLRAAPLRDAGAPDSARPDVYAHHPPALAMAVAVAFQWLGEDEDSARLVPALATLLMLMLFARLVHLVAGAAVAGLATLAVASEAMVSVYGAHVDVQGAPVLCLSVGVVLAYRRWRLGGALWPLLLVSLLASAFDWFGLYAPVACAAHLWFTDRGRRRAAIGLLTFAVLVFVAWVGWLVTLPGMSMGQLRRAAGVRGAGALIGVDDRLLVGVRAWLADTGGLMPGWPVLLLLSLMVLVGVLRPSVEPDDDAASRGGRGPLGARGLLGLLLLPPLAHGLLFPAGMLLHSYWLFGLPLGLGLGFALAVRRLRPGVGLMAATVLVLAGLSARQDVLAERDELPMQVGETLARFTAPEDVILTNYDTNPPAEAAADGEADDYVLMLPEVTFYSDRVVRGGIKGEAQLAAALRRRPDAVWFLEVPWPEPPGDDLLIALAERSDGAALSLSESPPVRLHRLRR